MLSVTSPHCRAHNRGGDYATARERANSQGPAPPQLPGSSQLAPALAALPGPHRYTYVCSGAPAAGAHSKVCTHHQPQPPPLPASVPSPGSGGIAEDKSPYGLCRPPAVFTKGHSRRWCGPQQPQMKAHSAPHPTPRTCCVHVYNVTYQLYRNKN